MGGQRIFSLFAARDITAAKRGAGPPLDAWREENNDWLKTAVKATVTVQRTSAWSWGGELAMALNSATCKT